MRIRTAVEQALSALAVAAVISVPATRAMAQRTPGPSGVKVGLQIATGTLVTPVAFVAGGLATKWFARHLGGDEKRESRLAYVGAWTAAGLATAAIPPLLVRGGTYPAAVGGAAIGAGAAALMVKSGRAMFRDDAHCGVVCTTWGIAAFALPATGATLLYNSSR